MSFLIVENELNWQTNYEKAIAIAAKKQQPILIFFHGSDWCPPCIKMQNEVFLNKEFIDFASNKLVFLNIDFPYSNPLSAKQLKHNTDVKLKFGLPKEFKEGFPQIIIINPDGKIRYQKKGYEGKGADDLMTTIKDLLKNS